jgi:hypothetical protein
MGSLDWMGQTSQPVQQLFAGDFGAAGRQTADLVGRVANTIIPFGDPIPRFVSKADFTSPSELVGLEDAPWYAKLPVDIAGDVVTSPLSAMSFGGSGAAAKVAKGAAGSIARGRGASIVSKLTGEIGQSAIDAVQAAAPTRAAAVAREAGLVGTTAAERLVTPLSQTAKDYLVVAARRQKSLDNLRRAGGVLKGTEDYQELMELNKLLKVGAGNATDVANAKIRLDDALKLANETKAEMDVMLSRVSQEGVEDVAAGAGIRNVTNEIPTILEGEMNAVGRRALTKGGEEAQATMRSLRDAIGQDFSKENIRSVLRRPEYEKMFDQGGISFAGKQIVTPEAIGKLASKVGSFVPSGVKETLSPALQKLSSAGSIAKSALGWDFSDNAQKAIKYAGIAEGSAVARRSLGRAAEVAKGLNKTEDTLLSQVFDNFAYKGGKPFALLDEATDMAFTTSDEVKNALLKRIEIIKFRGPAVTDVNLSNVDFTKIRDKILKTVDADVDDMREFMDTGVLPKDASDVGHGVYLRREMTGKQLGEYDELVNELTGTNSMKDRVLDSDKALLDFLQEQKGVSFERSFSKRLLGRASIQGPTVARAKIVKQLLLDSDAVLGESKPAVEKLIRLVGGQDENMAKWMQGITSSIPPRNASRLLNKANRIFKPAAVYGVGIPRFGSIMRNEIGGIWQAGSEIGIDAALARAKQAPQNLWDSVAAAGKKAFGWNMPSSENGKLLGYVDDVYERAASGELRNMAAVKAELVKRNPILVQALEDGIFDGFVSSERLLADIFKNPGLKKVGDFLDMSGSMFQHVESGLRFGQYRDLIAQGVGRKAAAQHIRDSFLDYSVSSLANRRLRDVIPFIQFTAQSIPQQAKFLANNPSVGVAISNLYDTKDLELPPYMQGRAAIGMGRDNEGNQAVASGAGLPVETLTSIPSLPNIFSVKDLRSSGRQVRTGLLSQTQPLFKTAFAAVSGRDPYFDTPFGSYDVAPQFAQALGADEHSEAARLYNTAVGTGLLQPLVSPIQELSRATDSRKTIPHRLLNQFTGLRIMSVDENQALRQKIEEILSDNPSVRRGQYLYSTDKDPKTVALLKALAEAKAKVKARKQGLE